MNISIFAKPTFININPHEPFSKRTKPVPKGRGHLMRVSSMIRGDQIADEIGAKFNPKSGYENDICIYVKPMVRKNEDFEFKGKVNYLDIIDGWGLLHLLEKHPEVKVIVCSQADMELLTGTISNDIVFIPQHHCNYDRVHRNRTEITKVGVIGEIPAFDFLPEGLEEALKQRKMELVKFSRFFSRQDIINFYMNIDVQIVWRPYIKTLSNPLKIVNASSFGVPTIALDETAFHEMEGAYMPVGTLEEFLSALDSLKTSLGLYESYSKACIDISERYHITNVGNLYKNLK